MDWAPTEICLGNRTSTAVGEVALRFRQRRVEASLLTAKEYEAGCIKHTEAHGEFWRGLVKISA